jgi:nucleoside 2-deoxyribosyltransferase
MKRGSIHKEGYGSFDDAGVDPAGSAGAGCAVAPKKPCLTEGHKFDGQPVVCYLAGRISHSDWRRQLCEEHFKCEYFGGADCAEWPKSVPMKTPLNVVCNGPFAASLGDSDGVWNCKHTRGGSKYVRHGGRAAVKTYDHETETGGATEEKARLAPQAIIKLCLDAIQACDVVFAWVDGEPGEGTLFELGYAVALKKRVIIAYPHVDTVANAWFAALACTQQIEAPSPAEAFAVAFTATPSTTLVHELARRTTAISQGL